jgi:hypothetical protein
MFRAGLAMSFAKSITNTNTLYFDRFLRIYQRGILSLSTAFDKKNCSQLFTEATTLILTLAIRELALN